MKRLLHIVFLAAAVCTSGGAFAQISASDTAVSKARKFDESVFGVGLHASLTDGMGVSFRHRIAHTSVAYQLNGGIIKLNESLLYSCGGEFQFDLSGGESDRVYALAGGGYYYKGIDSNDYSTPVRIGIGIGYEFPLTKQIGVSAAVLVMGFLPGGSILPLPQISMHYFFK